MKEKAPAFQWYPKDCDTDERVRAMDDREFGFYVRCLNHAWLNGGLPTDPAEIMRVIGRSTSYINKVWPRVCKCFILSETRDRLVNARQEAERNKQDTFRESMREASAKRWHGKLKAKGMPTDNGTESSSISYLLSADTSPTPSSDVVSGWDEFQATYPEQKRDIGVEPACRAYTARIDGTPGEHIRLMEGLRRYLESDQWARAIEEAGGRFIPTMERFITNGLYLDHPQPAEKPADYTPNYYHPPQGSNVH